MGRGRRRMTAARVTVAVGDHPGWVVCSGPRVDSEDLSEDHHQGSQLGLQLGWRSQTN